MGEFLRRAWYWLHRGRLEREMAEEMAIHREQLEAEGGRDFGSELRFREDAREVWGWTCLDGLRQDVEYGVRVLRHSRGFTLTATLLLGPGIGVPLTAYRAMRAGLEGGSAPEPKTLVRLTRRAPGVQITSLPYPELVCTGLVRRSVFVSAFLSIFRNRDLTVRA